MNKLNYMWKSLIGVYTWEHPGGSFEVVLRPNTVFYCPSYPANAKWFDIGDKVEIDWRNYGAYILNKCEAENEFEGSVVGNPSKWRKMKFLRPFNELETTLLGDGGGSVWDFQWEKGNFEIEFRVDGLNHFVCPSFPAHSHWLIDGNKVMIDWGKYGKYELEGDSTGRNMAGSALGFPSKWRKATFLRGLSIDSLNDVPAHDHGHGHVHGENCDHDH